ncbi:quinoprotein relay system zinc metallohydrolase 1 [Marinobacterium sediminicola]|uniref:Quinoprotein relay system zinc metallohydrolase 1 n=1 Tax=Marinobacterium sediminicola TaxID=518898 RepID=A0ABY1RXN0_9GAMM|nr:quinoprotein relay system zinc metallohydrolase 1 [Marinobacterium sediminicola]ULG67740.1 quinoprotein relay system zinc metallohydrolase 1 [Marinobacterium sediminicola]SMR71616.1 quinoprotein relay system zinc metallohydrolase 1 [Marinobacterium sediminicola]
MRILTLLMVMTLSIPVIAAPLEYNLSAEKVALNTWFIEGKTEDFSFENGGNIVNTAFIVTNEGVVVLDTGVSRRYGEALHSLIRSITDKPIKLVVNTHQHPDHFLGNQAFDRAVIASLEHTRDQIRQNGDAFAENMYRLVGDWMRGTEVVVPEKVIEPGMMEMGGHRLEWIELTGHSGSDLVLYDHTTGVLFPFDMVFYQRALTTPHTPGLNQWRSEIQQLRQIPFRIMLPGHGPKVTDHRALDQMSDYLSWLDETLKSSAEAGMSMTEVMALPIPSRFGSVALRQAEFERSVVHLYPEYEVAVFDH